MPPEDQDQPDFNPYAPPAAGEDAAPQPAEPVGHEKLRDRLAHQELGLGGLFSIGWGIYFANLKTILLCGAVVYLPTNLILVLLPADPNAPELSQLTYYARMGNVINMLVGVVAIMAVMTVVIRHVEGERIGFGQAMSQSVQRWGHAIGTNILAGLWLLLMFICLIIPGIIYSVYYNFIVPAVILNNMAGKQALAYSKSLVEGRWWQIFGYAFVIGLTQMGLLTTVGIIPGVFTGLTGKELPLVEAAFGALGETFGSYFAVMEAIWFLNMHRMREAQQQILTSAIGQGPGLPPEQTEPDELYPPLDWPPKT